MSNNDADDRLRTAIIRAIDMAPASSTRSLVEDIMEEVYGEVVAGASVVEMARAMGEIRMNKERPTYAALGRAIWQIRYDQATEEYDRETRNLEAKG